MNRKLRLALATVGVGLGLVPTSAHASRFAFDDQDIGFQFATLSFRIVTTTVTCPVSLTGSFHSRTIAKVEGSLIGHITQASIGRCTGGTAVALSVNLPWHIVYEGFFGDLPEIDALWILIVNASFVIDTESSASLCLIRSTTTDPLKGDLALDWGTNKFDLLDLDPTSVIAVDDVAPSVLCDQGLITSSLDGLGSAHDGSGGLVLIRLV